MQYLRALIESRPMLERIPDQWLIANDPLGTTERIEACRGSDGSYAFIYTATGRKLKIRMIDGPYPKLSGKTIRGWWYDPRQGSPRPRSGNSRKPASRTSRRHPAGRATTGCWCWTTRRRIFRLRGRARRRAEAGPRIHALAYETAIQPRKILWPISSAPFRGFPAVHPFPKADALGYDLSPYRAQRQSERYGAQAQPLKSRAAPGVVTLITCEPSPSWRLRWAHPRNSLPSPWTKFLSSAFPTELTAAPAGGKVAWVSNAQRRAQHHAGRAAGLPGPQDHGVHRGRRPGTGESRLDAGRIAPSSTCAETAPTAPANTPIRALDPNGAEQDLWIVALDGSAPRKIGEGHSPAVSPRRAIA